MQATGTARGSEKVLEKLFGTRTQVSRAELADALAATGTRIDIVRLLWKGQPAIDRILAKVLVPREQASSAIERLLDNQSEQLQVSLGVFPYGIPKVEQIAIDLDLEFSSRRA